MITHTVKNRVRELVHELIYERIQDDLIKQVGELAWDFGERNPDGSGNPDAEAVNLYSSMAWDEISKMASRQTAMKIAGDMGVARELLAMTRDLIAMDFPTHDAYSQAKQFRRVDNSLIFRTICGGLKE